MSSGLIGSYTHDYKRHGTTCLYAAFNILTGKVMGKIQDKHRASEFLDFLNHIDRHMPRVKQLHIILDNYSAHKTPEVMTWLEKHPRVHFHFTPTSASWLNAAESWFAQLERRSLFIEVCSQALKISKTKLNGLSVFTMNN